MRQQLLVMLAEGGLTTVFEDARKSYEITNGENPKRYCVPQYLHDVLEIIQEQKPTWQGCPLDPWAKDEVRGQ